MRRGSQSTKGKPSRSSVTGGVSVTFNEADLQKLQKINAWMRNRPAVSLFNFLYSSGSALMCSPKEELHERTVSLLTSLNVMGGLVFSGIASSAMNPLNVTSFPQETQGVAYAFNLLAMMTLGVNTCLIVFSTYSLFMVFASSQTSDLALRNLLHFTPMIGLMQFASFMTLFGVLAMICTAAHLRMPSFAAWIATAVVVGTFIFLYLVFVEIISNAFPWEVWNWSSVGMQWKLFSHFQRNEAWRISSLQLAEAEKHIMAGLSEDHDGEVNMDGEMKADELELVALVDKALPELCPDHTKPRATHQVLQARHDMLIRKLVAAKITLPTMKKTARQPGGFHVLIDMLSAEPLGSHLMPGEVMALAAEVMEAAIVAESKVEKHEITVSNV